MQVTIARQLGLDPSTVSNFFMNARRRSVDKWKDDTLVGKDQDNDNLESEDEEELIEDDYDQEDPTPPPQHHHHQAQAMALTTRYQEKVNSSAQNTVLVTANPAAVVQHVQHGDALTPTAALDLWPAPRARPVIVPKKSPSSSAKNNNNNNRTTVLRIFHQPVKSTTSAVSSITLPNDRHAAGARVLTLPANPAPVRIVRRGTFLEDDDKE